MEVTPVGDFRLTWGESLRWDERRQRLYFVDCALHTLHWLDGGEPPLHTLQMTSLPTGVALTGGDELVICLDDGLAVVHPDAGTSERLAPYPPGMHGRANDANADPAGNLVTGTLNFTPGPGAYWWFSLEQGWRHLDDGIGNANGPAIIDIAGQTTLIFGDTQAGVVYAYPYEPATGSVGRRRVYADYTGIGGVPDGATADATGDVWSCVLPGKLARLSPTGIDQIHDLPVPNPSDVAFGGAQLDRLYLTSIALDLGLGEPTDEAGHLFELHGHGTHGRPEHRFRLQ